MDAAVATDNRWELYKILSDPSRLRLLAVASEEELAIGELAELLGESQPTVSRQVAPLRRLGLLAERRQGARVLVQLDAATRTDPVVSDALHAGRALCKTEGVLDRIAGIVAKRDAPAREFFAQAVTTEDLSSFPSELPAYLATLALLLDRRSLAFDLGTGDGRLLEVLAPAFERVVAVDREPARLARAAERLSQRGHDNVSLVRGDMTDDGLASELAQHGSPDAVFAARVLHHAPRPTEAVGRLAALVGPGARLVVLDYAAHEEEGMRAQGDVWLGFQPSELEGAMRDAGLEDVRSITLPSAFCGTGPDRHLRWLACVGRRAPNPGGPETIGSPQAE